MQLGEVAQASGFEMVVDASWVWESVGRGRASTLEDGTSEILTFAGVIMSAWKEFRFIFFKIIINKNKST